MDLRIFIVDDDPDYARLLEYQLRKEGSPEIRLFSSGEEGAAAVDEEPDVILLDVVMPGQGGLETLRHIKEKRPEIPVVMVSAQSVVSVALEAMKLGAYDYVTKGHDDTIKLRSIVSNIRERVLLARQVRELREQLDAPQGLRGLIGESASMAHVFRTIQKTLRGDLTVAIVGESGTGKELVAHAIHHNSPRKRESFVLVNCAAIPRELMESEFFGHEKGSFTGAHARKIGKFERANEGTIFLDEIGELDHSLQAKLLRVLQSGELQRVGGSETIRVDVRVLCATNRDVPLMVRDGTFREDLYYRLFQFPLHLPPLRDRDQDVLLLADHFRRTFSAAHRDVEPRDFARETRRALLRYDWPGNVRELKNAVERSLLISDGAEIQPDDLMLGETRLGPSRPVSDFGDLAAGNPNEVSTGGPVSAVQAARRVEEILPLEDVKHIAVEHAYKLCGGNINQTAARLGVTRSTIYRLMRKYGIDEIV